MLRLHIFFSEVLISRMSVVGPEYLKLNHTERQRHTYALSTHTSLSPPSILSLPLGFSVLAHDERLADANDRKQDLFSSFQQIFCWSCLRVEALTLQQPLVSRSLSLSLFSHPHTNTHNNTENVFSFTINT